MPKLNRRQFLRASTGVFVAPYLSARAFGSTAVPGYEISEVKTISLEPNVYYGWPTVAKRGSELLVVSSGGREGHVCPFGRVDLTRSKDGGETWSWQQTIYDGPIDDRDAGICITNKGTILVTTFTSDAYVTSYLTEAAGRARGEKSPAWGDERFARWTAAHRRLADEERANEVGSWILRSEDGGINWDARQETRLNGPHGPTQLADGRLVYCGKELWTRESRVGAEISTDDGKTWTPGGFIPAREGDSLTQYHELHAVEAANGTIVCQIRNHNPTDEGETLQTVSKDGGETWAKPRSIGVWGYPSFLTRLRDDRLLMTYGYRRAPLGVQARTSDDNGETWSAPIQIYGDGETGDLGYPSTVQLDDGALFTVWYEVQNGSWSARLRAAKWRLN
ncbi:MAG: exo-alpha-sialidase [Thermoguttaceae bacterium]|nr:exo-alpha-sialidase [Thermoguttaceae bacterium]